MYNRLLAAAEKQFACEENDKTKEKQTTTHYVNIKKKTPNPDSCPSSRIATASNFKSCER